MASLSDILESDTDSEEEVFGFTADNISIADISGESDISADKRSNESGTEDKESNSSLVESEMKKSGATILSLLLLKISTNPPGLQLFFQPQRLLVTFST